MKIAIRGNESPEVLRAVAAVFMQLAAERGDDPLAKQRADEMGRHEEELTGQPEPPLNDLGEPYDRERTAGEPAPQTDARLDQNGVAFDPAYCGEATEPFYASGKRAGQWKKKRGVSEGDYDAWYAGAAAAEPDAAELNTAAAFSNAPAEPSAPSVPQDTGQFMGWVSEQQAAGNLTQDRIAAAYQMAGVQVADLFPPADPADVQARIAQIYGILTQ